MLNKVLLVGNLGRDPEVRTTPGGSQVCNLSLATTERVKNREGAWEDQTEWHRVVCFGRTAENVARFKKKGETLYVEGRIRTNKWKDKDGQDRYTTEIIADSIKFIGGGRGDDRQPGNGGGSHDDGGSFGGGDDSIPF
jgi:single-strand DNA-binding protein